MKIQTKIFTYVLPIVAAGLIASCGAGSGAGASGDLARFDGGAALMSISVKLASMPAAASMSKEAGTSENELATADAAGGIVTITEARVVVQEIELGMPEGRSCDDEMEAEIEGEDDGECAPAAAPAGEVLASESADSAEDEAVEDSTDDSADERGEVENETEDHLKFTGPFIVDLLTGTSVPSIADLTVPSGVYTSVEVKVEPLPLESTAVAADDPLLGQGLVVKGTYDDGVSVREFLVASRIDKDIEFKPLEGFTISEALALNEIIVTFDVNAWFQGINIGACLDSGAPTIDANGVALITDETPGDACAFKDLLEQNIEQSGTAEVDDDESDDVGDDEVSS